MYCNKMSIKEKSWFQNTQKKICVLKLPNPFILEYYDPMKLTEKSAHC
jgi:hypothetical protein